MVYHRGDVTLIDDALSAVDAHVAKHLFENALVHELMTSDNGSTDTRSVVLITNAIQYLNHPRVDKIIVLHEGRIVEEGTYDSLLRKQNSMFARFISVIEKNNFSENTNKSKNVVVKPQPEQMTELTTTSSETKEEVNSNKLMTEEVRGKGQVGIEVYRKWATAAGGVIVPVLLSITFVLFEATSVLSNWWLTYWSAHGNEGQSQIYFLQVYTIIGTAAAVADLGRSTFVNYFCLQASRKVSNALCLKCVVCEIMKTQLNFSLSYSCMQKCWMLFSKLKCHSLIRLL